MTSNRKTRTSIARSAASAEAAKRGKSRLNAFKKPVVTVDTVLPIKSGSPSLERVLGNIRTPALVFLPETNANRPNANYTVTRDRQIEESDDEDHIPSGGAVARVITRDADDGSGARPQKCRSNARIWRRGPRDRSSVLERRLHDGPRPQASVVSRCGSMEAAMRTHDTEVLSDVQPSGTDDSHEKGNMHQNHIQSIPAKSLLQFLIGIRMTALATLVAVALGLAVSSFPQAARAQEYPWCLSREGYLYCFYQTQQQCQWTASGIGGCALNPRLLFPEKPPDSGMSGVNPRRR